MRTLFIYIARGLISLIFLFAGVGKLMNWQGTVDALSMVFSNWYIHLEGAMSHGKHEFLVGNALFFLGVAVFLEIVGGLLLLFGVKVKWGAAFLLIFLVPTTILFHSFWFEVGADQHKELAVFLKNLALIGALLYILVAPQLKRSNS